MRSSRKDATQISDSEVRKMVRDAVEFTGGLSDIIEDGQFVVIKPNLVSSRTCLGTFGALSLFFSDPYKDSSQIPQKVNGLTVDWRVAKAMVELVREVNPSGKVYVMECSVEGQVSKTFEFLGYTHKNIPGVDQFVGLDETGDDYRAIDSDDLVAVDLEDKQQCNRLPDFLNNKYYFDKTFYNADVIISLACLKNHMNAAISGGIKNIGFGAMPGKIYGNNRKTINRVFTISHGWETINNFIHDYYMAKPVQFVVTDGLQGLAYGPLGMGAPSYNDAKMNMRLVLASKDPVAIDTVQAYIVGVDAEKVLYLVDLSRDGYGTIDSSKITVVGNARVDEVKKRFPFAKGIFWIIYGKPPMTMYDDYETPDIAIEGMIIKDKILTVKLKVDSKITKVEVHIDGKLVDTVFEGFGQMNLSLGDEISEGSHIISFYGYDRFLNCGYKTANFFK